MLITVARMYQLQQSDQWKQEWRAYYDGKSVGYIDDPIPYESWMNDYNDPEDTFCSGAGILVYGLHRYAESGFTIPHTYIDGDGLLEITIEVNPSTLKVALEQIDKNDPAFKELNNLLIE